MRKILWTFGLLLSVVPQFAYGQEPAAAQVASATSSVREQLLPAASAALLAPKPMLQEMRTDEAPAAFVVRRGEGTGYMIAGLALFVAGLVIDDDDAGTVLVLAGAGIGAYGLYLHFR